MFSSNASLNTFSRSSLLFVSTHRAMLCLPPQLSFVHIHFLSFGRGGNLTSPGTPECGPLTKRPRRPKELRPHERSWPWEVNAMVCEPPKEASTILYLSSSSSSSSSPPTTTTRLLSFVLLMLLRGEEEEIEEDRDGNFTSVGVILSAQSSSPIPSRAYSPRPHVNNCPPAVMHAECHPPALIFTTPFLFKVSIALGVASFPVFWCPNCPYSPCPHE
mmetsp:Transcript_11233/g.31751  ORF Transcript_11233/g.31751 Transcript_11233/m.31751 type:complete len:217 (-) Transcript_11233:1079-1729(-)